jgi:hypothetical protein
MGTGLLGGNDWKTISMPAELYDAELDGRRTNEIAIENVTKVVGHFITFAICHLMGTALFERK